MEWLPPDLGNWGRQPGLFGKLEAQHERLNTRILQPEGILEAPSCQIYRLLLVDGRAICEGWT